MKLLKLENLTPEELYDKLTPTQRDGIYHMVWCEHVEEDVRAQMEERDVSLDDATITLIARSYVNGHYDCNLSYWENINNLIDMYI